MVLAAPTRSRRRWRLRTVREVRQVLFNIEPQDAPIDLAGLLALGSGDQDLPERQADLLVQVQNDPRTAPEVADEARRIAERFGWA